MKPRRPEALPTVEKLMAAMLPDPEIVSRVKAQFGVSEPLVRRYIRLVREEWAERARGTLGEKREAMLARLAFVYQMALGSKDVRAALGVLREIAKVTGLYVPEVVRVEANPNSLAGVDTTDPDEARAMMAKIIRRHASELEKILPESADKGQN